MLSGEDTREKVDQAEGQVAFAEMLELLDKRKCGVLVGRRQLNGALRPPRGRSSIGERVAGKLPGGQGRIVAPPAPLPVDPAFRLGRPLDVEPIQKMALVQLEARDPIVPVDRGIEVGGVAPQGANVHSHFVVPTADDQVGAAGLSEEIERAAERGAGVFLIEVGPEAGEQGVAANRSAVGRRREVD